MRTKTACRFRTSVVRRIHRAGKCLPSRLGARVRSSNGKLSVTDGPFTESKELAAGFALLKVNSKEEAIELTRKFLQVAGDGECELRQIYEANTCAPAAAKA